MHLNRRFTVPVVALLLSGGVLVAPSTAYAEPSPSVPPIPDRRTATSPITANTAPGSIDYLTRTFHVSMAEAIRRLELQRTAARLQDDLAARFPNVYAGAWIDQEHGGILNIGATDPAKLTATLRGLRDREHITIVRVAHSRRDLLAAADRITIVGSSRVDLQACKLEYSIVSPK